MSVINLIAEIIQSLHYKIVSHFNQWMAQTRLIVFFPKYWVFKKNQHFFKFLNLFSYGFSPKTDVHMQIWNTESFLMDFGS